MKETRKPKNAEILRGYQSANKDSLLKLAPLLTIYVCKTTYPHSSLLGKKRNKLCKINSIADTP